MIKSLRVRNIATYDIQGSELNDLKKINFIYGSNGSGKTTISEVIRNTSHFKDCEIDWHGNEYKTVVYNRNFIKDNFRNDSVITGISTLGKESAEVQDTIEKKRISIAKHEFEIQSLRNTLQGKINEQQKNKDAFKEQCWTLKTKYEIEFKEVLKGVLNSREKFMDKCIKESSYTGKLISLEELKRKKGSVSPSVRIDVVDNFSV